jgi:hypothetical protein
VEGAPDELVVDNLDVNTSQTGTWSVSSGADPWDAQSLYSNADSTFRWTPEVLSAGPYDVYVWWTYHNNRSSTVPYTVAHAGGTDEVIVDQHDQALGGGWNLLGTYSFEAGSDGYVEVTSRNGQACADAVKLAWSGGNHAPVAVDQDVVTVEGTSVAITLEAVDADGDVVTFAIDVPPVSGVLIDFDATAGTVTYVPDTGFTGTDAFTFYASDGAYDSNLAVVSVAVNPSGSTEIVVDNNDENTATTGSWIISSGLNPWEGESMYSNSGSTFRWIPNVTVAGTYDVYAWWTYHSNRSSSVPYRIMYGQAESADTVTVDQHDSALGGQWNLLGRYYFEAGSAGYVEVSSENGQCCADAVMLVTAGAALSSASKTSAAPLSEATMLAMPLSEDGVSDPIDEGTPEPDIVPDETPDAGLVPDGGTGGGGGGGGCFVSVVR